MPRVHLAYEAGSLSAAESPSIELPYVIKDAHDEEEALLALVRHVSSIYLTRAGNTLYLQSLHVNKRIARRVWGGRALYGPRETGESLTAKIRFRTGGGSARIKSALATKKYPDSAPDVKKGIGATKDGIEGIDVGVGALEWEETWPVRSASIADGYAKRMSDMSFTTNNAPWRAFARGEVLFKGASGERETGKKWSQITYTFAGSPNAEGLDVGLPDNVKVDKKGWEYLEVKGTPKIDNVAMVLIAQPTAAYVHQVYRESNFRLLGIGG